MILSLDTSLALLLTILTTSVFLQVSSNFDFSIKEVASQRFTDSLALSLQEQKTLVTQLRHGNPIPITQEIEKIRGNYCIVIKTGGESTETCTESEKITRRFFTYSDGEFFEAIVETHFR